MWATLSTPNWGTYTGKFSGKISAMDQGYKFQDISSSFDQAEKRLRDSGMGPSPIKSVHVLVGSVIVIVLFIAFLPDRIQFNWYDFISPAAILALVVGMLLWGENRYFKKRRDLAERIDRGET